ncbi:hypothetical protein ACFWG6_29815 [Streptomyces erythrochromogenes]|uniref:hypothetical protein n=1 Tax=Streptomyces erythrochromogenes TaxID=285574 RepID=UPI00363158D0
MAEQQMYGVAHCEPCEECVLAREGAVHLPVGGPGGVPIALLRRLYGLSIAEVVAARAEGYRATPVEARYLTDPAP